ncbi:hypothetical protein CKF46_31555 [Klebsiella pneumoniae]|nr:hypothetical protein CKF46_36270 [Klebsiella pneumoniae]PAU40760.1 hypothetical protein CKF46_31555 [Klebsiella pneumoniae]
MNDERKDHFQRHYHNVALRAPLKRAERDSAANTAKRDVLPGVNRKNASGFAFSSLHSYA